VSELNQALAHHQAGRLKEAEGLYREILRAQPGNADALHLLGMLTAQGGHCEAAAGLIERAIQINPKVAEYHNSLGETRRALGQGEGAISAYRQALALKPDYVAARYNLGNALQAQGDLKGAIAAYRRVLALSPDDVAAHNNLGVALGAQQKYAEAVTHLERARALDPHSAEICFNLGNTLTTSSGPSQAIAAYRDAIALQPDYPEAYNGLGTVLELEGTLDEAIAAYRRAIALKPEYAEAFCNLGSALHKEGKPDLAIACYERAIALNPDKAEAAYSNLGTALKEQGKSTEAIAAYQQALVLAPESAGTHVNLANALLYQGKLREAIATYRHALELRSDAAAHSSLLFALQYSDSVDPDSIQREHKRWARHHALRVANVIQPHDNDPDPERRLRIGYVSPDFHTHSVAFFIEPILAHYDRQRYEVFCYNNERKTDAVTDRLRTLVDHWRDIARLSDERVARLIRADGIDILVDLAGHTTGNRLLVFARKPAPVQVTYLGYPNSTGLATIDYRLTDTLADPPTETQVWHSETLVRLPRGFLCYQPPANAPAVAPPPVATTHQVTFGSFNNPTKISDATIAYWADILRRTPNARLLLKARQLGDVATRERLKGLFAQHGIATERVEMVSWVPDKAEHLGLYHQIDIALDTFPYNGTTTTCEALWMGVPVVILAGRMHAGRVGVSILTHIGLPELIAEDPEGYVQLATSLAQDLGRLKTLRAELRQKMLHSPLMDANGFSQRLEMEYRNMWRQWVNEVSSPGDQIRQDRLFHRTRTLDEIAVRIRGGVDVCVPNCVQLLTPYVLLEQEDWFEKEIAFVRHLLKPGMCAVDIGASYGVYSLAMAKAVEPSGQVWSFEPARGPAAFLTSSTQRNHLDNLDVSQVALSARSGSASLRAADDSELGSIVTEEDLGADYDRVHVVTLDDCARNHGWKDIDFVKIDAEGEEARIVEGGRRFLSEQSPLVLFELKHGDQQNFSLLNKFPDAGYQLYRLVPGLGVLVPWASQDSQKTIDPFELNVFACRADRAQLLEKQGLLAQKVTRPCPPITKQVWDDFSCNLSYAQDVVGDWKNFESAKPAPWGEEYQRALSAYATAHALGHAPSLRFAYLERSFEILLGITEDAATVCRLQTLARVSWEIGEREVAVKALNSLIERLENGELPFPHEPFLAASTRFDHIRPRGDLTGWFLASAFEQYVTLRAHSSYFTGTTGLNLLEQMKLLPFYGPAMERRRLLIRIRHFLQSGPELHPLLTHRTEEHLNAAFWTGEYHEL
jgi:protein O-GlcNAc transferase